MHIPFVLSHCFPCLFVKTCERLRYILLASWNHLPPASAQAWPNHLNDPEIMRTIVDAIVDVWEWRRSIQRVVFIYFAVGDAQHGFAGGPKYATKRGCSEIDDGGS